MPPDYLIETIQPLFEYWDDVWVNLEYVDGHWVIKIEVYGIKGTDSDAEAGKITVAEQRSPLKGVYLLVQDLVEIAVVAKS